MQRSSEGSDHGHKRIDREQSNEHAKDDRAADDEEPAAAGGRHLDEVDNCPFTIGWRTRFRYRCRSARVPRLLRRGALGGRGLSRRGLHCSGSIAL